MTKRDQTLSKVLEMTKRGIFPLKSKDEELKQYVLVHNVMYFYGVIESLFLQLEDKHYLMNYLKHTLE